MFCLVCTPYRRFQEIQILGTKVSSRRYMDCTVRCGRVKCKEVVESGLIDEAEILE